MKSLIGRYVYFKMSKKKLEENDTIFYTPGKLYRIIGISKYNMIQIKSDTGYIAETALGILSHHLNEQAKWTLKRKVKPVALGVK